MNNISDNVIGAAITSMMNQPNFVYRMTKIISSLSETEEILNSLADGVPVEVKEYNSEALCNTLGKKEILGIKVGPLVSKVKFTYEIKKYFKTVEDAKEFKRQGYCSNGLYKYSEEYPIEAIYTGESENEYSNLYLRQNGVVFKYK